MLDSDETRGRAREVDAAAAARRAVESALGGDGGAGASDRESRRKSVVAPAPRELPRPNGGKSKMWSEMVRGSKSAEEKMRRGSGAFSKEPASSAGMTEEDKRKSAKQARMTRKLSLFSADSSRDLHGHKDKPGREVSDKRRTQMAAFSQRPQGVAPLEGVAEDTPHGGSATERDERGPPMPAAQAEPAAPPGATPGEADPNTACFSV